MSKTLSIRPDPFSNDMEYEKPEHPPPTTPTRKPAGVGFCCPIISLTLATAFAVRLIGAVFTSGVFTSGVVVVAIRISLKLLSRDYYNKPFPEALAKLAVPKFGTAFPTLIR